MNILFRNAMLIYFIFPLLIIAKSLDAHSHVDYSEETSARIEAQENLTSEDRVLFDELKTAFDMEAQPMETPEENFSMESLPQWAEGEVDRVKRYYTLHAESFFDQMLGGIASRFGVIVHGNMNQDQLAAHLCTFNIAQLLSSGPYPNSTLSIPAQQLIFDSLQLPQIYDIHIHNLGYDEDNYLNPNSAARGVAAWSDYFTFMVLRYAAGMSTPFGSTQEARRRIQLYAEHFPKLCGIILPIHQAVLPDGHVDWENTGSHLSNEAALKTAQTFQSDHSQLIAAVSIHPFDLDWKWKMLTAHSQGVRLIKWMPPQSIPPDSPQIDEYYHMMKALGMTLIAHAGPEHTIPTNDENREWADWGNPLRFRKPLQIGVNVILAHCGHKDKIPDLDDPEQLLVQGFQLFLRLAREAHWKNITGEWSGKLYGDLAGVLAHYGSDFIRELLLCAHEEGVRLVYGSDYPFTNLIQPSHDAYDECVTAGLLDEAKLYPLKEIRNWNPLLANYVFARNLAIETRDGPITFPEKAFSGEMLESSMLFDSSY